MHGFRSKLHVYKSMHQYEESIVLRFFVNEPTLQQKLASLQEKIEKRQVQCNNLLVLWRKKPQQLLNLQYMNVKDKVSQNMKAQLHASIVDEMKELRNQLTLLCGQAIQDCKTHNGMLKDNKLNNNEHVDEAYRYFLQTRGEILLQDQISKFNQALHNERYEECQSIIAVINKLHIEEAQGNLSTNTPARSFLTKLQRTLRNCSSDKDDSESEVLFDTEILGKEVSLRDASNSGSPGREETGSTASDSDGGPLQLSSSPNVEEAARAANREAMPRQASELTFFGDLPRCKKLLLAKFKTEFTMAELQILKQNWQGMDAPTPMPKQQPQVRRNLRPIRMGSLGGSPE